MDRRQPLPFSRALLPLFAMVLSLALGSWRLGGGRPVLIGSMLVAATVAALLAVRRGARFADIERATGEKLAAVLPMLLILLAIGMLIGSWVFSGTIPLLLKIGLRLVSAQWLVPTAFVVTALMSVCTGTSWGSAGTIGVALMGMAQALDVSLAATAGAVVSGAYVGDKISPLSDTTNICALAARVPLMTHVRHLLYTAVPSFVLALVVYAAAGQASLAPADAGHRTTQLLYELDRLYRLDFWAILPLLLVLVGIARGLPPAVTMAASSLLALVLGCWHQGLSLQAALVAAIDGFSLRSFPALDVATLDPAVPRLLERGGVVSMVEPLLYILCAFLLAGAMDVAGALDSLVHGMLRSVRGVTGLIGATLLSGVIVIALTSHAGVTALLIGSLFAHAYTERGLAPQNLSRCLEDSATIVEPILPWTVSAIFMSTTLGVPTADYLPWAIFCFSGAVFSFAYGLLSRRGGFGIARL
jgi:NhaC family Na+:H+ antiporter